MMQIIKSIVVVFTDLPAAQAKDFFGGVLQQIGAPSYANDGLVMGPFYEGNDGTAVYNPTFRPFTSPVPFLLMRRAVVSDWKLFLNNEDWLRLWAHRYGEAAVQALADETTSSTMAAQRTNSCRRTSRSNAEESTHDHQRLHRARAGQSGRETGPARPVPDRGLPGPERRADATYAARQVDTDLARRRVASLASGPGRSSRRCRRPRSRSTSTA